MSFKNKSLTIQASIQLGNKLSNFSFILLKKAIQSPYAPELSQKVRSELDYQINQLLN